MSSGNLPFITRFPSHDVQIGEIPMGSNHPIRLQSMTNTNTLNVQATIEQCIRILNAGADYVRISAPTMQAAHKLKEIKSGLIAAGFNNPVIADIHFNPDVALEAAKYVEKIRINPGNYIRSSAKNKIHFNEAETKAELEIARKKLKPLVDICKENGTAIRIGTNMGSLSARIVSHYGNTPQGMVMATFEFLELFRELDFNNLVVSLKASKPLVMVQAYEAMVEKMLESNMKYPLHIGITEAGDGENGRIKSALGICTLLNKGIGDTLRVSLTEPPEDEIPFARKISSFYQNAFSQKNTFQKYHIRKLDDQGSEIFFPFSKIKAVVVESEKIKDNLSSANFTHPGVLEKNPEDKLIADYFYTNDSSLAEKNKDKNFIISLNKLKNTKVKNIISLVDADIIERYDFESEKSLLQFSCTNDDIIFKLTTDSKPLAVVTYIRNCEETCNLQNLVNICQSNKIPLILRKRFCESDTDDIIIRAAIQFGNYLLEKRIQGLWLEEDSLLVNTTEISFGFLQSAGLRITRTEFISCPTCARTSFELQKVLHEVQNHFSGMPGLKIAVMGCVVNGPGEMADADFGFVGTATGKLHLYKAKTPIIKNIEPSQAVEKLTQILRQYGYFK